MSSGDASETKRSAKHKWAKRIAGMLIGFVLLVALEFAYIIPNALGSNYLASYVSPAVSCEQVVGVLLVVKNSYFLPVIVDYDGADLAVNVIEGANNHTLYTANFLSEDLHDEEEGLHHVARIPPGTHQFLLRFDESSQFYSSGGKLPNIPYTLSEIDSSTKHDKFILQGTAFGLYVDSMDRDILLVNKYSKSECLSKQ